MKISTLIGNRFKERPSEASTESHAFLLRGGYIRSSAPGIYSLLPLGVRVLHNIERVFRKEIDALQGQEVRTPLVMPKDTVTDRPNDCGSGGTLLHCVDRNNQSMVCASGDSASIVLLAGNETNSYKQYPYLLYQIMPLFRDEPRIHSDIGNLREYTLFSAASFHVDRSDSERMYHRCDRSFKKIFAALGIPSVIRVQSETADRDYAAGHEYMLVHRSGERGIVHCINGDYHAPIEAASGVRVYHKEEPKELVRVHTPGTKTIEAVATFLQVGKERTAKAVFFQTVDTGALVLALIRGDLEVNESKLSRVIGATLVPAAHEAILSSGAVPGFACGMNLSDCRVICDMSIKESSDLVCGANREDYHYLHFNMERELPSAEVHDIAQVKPGDRCPLCGDELLITAGIRIGETACVPEDHICTAGIRYLDNEGKERMPCINHFRVCLERLLWCIIESSYDAYGPIWPITVAPFEMEILTINLDASKREPFSDAAYCSLLQAGFSVLYDDRTESAGVKFADADLIGAPLRLIFGSKNFDAKRIEWKVRGRKESGVLALDELPDFARRFVRDEYKKYEITA